MTVEIAIAKAVTHENTYFIFRENGDEVTINSLQNGRINTDHKLTADESNFLFSNYPVLFKDKQE